MEINDALEENIKKVGIDFKIVIPDKKKGKKDEKVKVKLTCQSFLELNYALRMLNKVLEPLTLGFLQSEWS